jgi:hypothetical protein
MVEKIEVVRLFSFLTFFFDENRWTLVTLISRRHSSFGMVLEGLKYSHRKQIHESSKLCAGFDFLCIGQS